MDYIHEPQPNDGTVRPLPRRLGPSVPDGVLAGTRESVPSLGGSSAGTKPAAMSATVFGVSRSSRQGTVGVPSHLWWWPSGEGGPRNPRRKT